MYKITIISEGKTKERWLEEAIAIYCKRLSTTVNFEFLWAKNEAQVLKHCEKHHPVIALDPLGKTYSSEDFSHFVMEELVTNGCRLCFVIGGAEGLAKELRENSKLLSLSKLTFTHQMTRLILIEQVYRALEIAKGSQYHKA